MRPSRRDDRRFLPSPRRIDPTAALPLTGRRTPQPSAALPAGNSGGSSSSSLLGRLLTLGVLLTFGSATSLMLGAAWLSAQSLLNPDVEFWLNQSLSKQNPRLSPTSAQEAPQTLAEIRAALQLSQRRAGEWIRLDAAQSLSQTSLTSADLLLPVWQESPDCRSGCQTLGELRVYRLLQLPALLRQFQSRQYFRLIDQTAIAQPQEAEILAPIASSKLANYGSTRRLPFTHIQRDSDLQRQPGVWLQLSGQLSQARTSYGQIFYYSPGQGQLRLLLRWHSPTGTHPTWQAVTAGQSPDLVVNQTVGLAPAYQIYQVRGGADGFPQLVSISLSSAALPHPTYREGLRLAQAGLWSEALALLTSVQASSGGSWSSAAQAQLAVVRFYAQLSRQQSEQPAVSPAQEVVAQLFDGRWHRGLERWQAAADLEPELQPLLQAEARPLMRRVEAALSYRPGHPAALLWGTLITAAQAGEPAAIAWLRQQPGQDEAIAAQAKVWLRRLTADPSSPVTPGSAPAATPTLPTPGPKL